MIYCCCKRRFTEGTIFERQSFYDILVILQLAGFIQKLMKFWKTRKNCQDLVNRKQKNLRHQKITSNHKYLDAFFTSHKYG